MKMAILKTVLPAAMFAVALAPAMGQKQTPPEGAPAKAFTVPAHETYTLPNGMKVTMVPYGNIPKVTVSVAVQAGGIDEGGHVGVAGLTAKLLKEGTAALTSAQLAGKAAGMGGSLDVSASDDQTIAQIDVLTEFGPDAVRLVADVLEHPRMPESELARLKNDTLRQIAVDTSRPQVIAEMRFRKILYGDHPYAIVEPTEGDVKKLALQNVKDFAAANITAGRSHLYVAGKFDTAAVKKAIGESFGAWARGGKPRVQNPPAPHASRILDFTDRPDAPQSTLIVGLPVPASNSPDAIRIRVMNNLLGGSFNSRITANIREQKGYTYSPFSQISERYHDAYWAESADVTTQFTGASIKEILGEINRLSSEPPSAPELQGIQKYMAGLFVIVNSNRGALISQLQNVDFQGLGEDYLTTYVAKVNAITPEDVEKMAAQYLKPGQMTIVVVGDKAKVADQIAPYAAGNPL